MLINTNYGKLINIKTIVMVMIVFFFIFGLKTPVGSLAQILTGLILILGLFLYRADFIKINNVLFYIICFLIYDLFICLLWPIIFNTYDFSIIPTKINFILSIIASYILAIYMINNFSEKSFFRLISIVFFIQGAIVLMMLINPSFSEFIMLNTKSDAIYEKMMNSYGGARGLGLADSAAFGFSVTMGLFLLITCYLYLKEYINFKFFLMILSLGIIAATSAGRVSLIGLFLGIFLILLCSTKIKHKFSLFVIFTFISLFFYYLIEIRYTGINNDALQRMYNYSMEPIFNYLDYGEFRTSSTDGLMNMYFPLTEKQFLLGDARYSGDLGQGYYLDTDAGFMRFTLFYGFLNSFILYLFFIFYLAYFSFKKLKFGSDFIFIIFMLILSTLLHYKGEVVLFSIAYNKLLFLVFFFIILSRSRFVKSYI